MQFLLSDIQPPAFTQEDEPYYDQSGGASHCYSTGRVFDHSNSVV